MISRIKQMNSWRISESLSRWKRVLDATHPEIVVSQQSTSGFPRSLEQEHYISLLLDRN